MDKQTSKPLPSSSESNVKPTTTPIRPKSPARPPSSPGAAKKLTSAPPVNNSALIVDLGNEALGVDGLHQQQAVTRPPPAEVFVTDPDGERTEPVEDEEEGDREEEEEVEKQEKEEENSNLEKSEELEEEEEAEAEGK